MMDDLDALFAAAKSADTTPSDRLMARVMADAAALQPKAAALARAPQPSTGFWAGLAALFGGGGVLAGLATVALAGFYVGFAQPASVMALADGLIVASNVETVDLMPGVDALLSEE